MASRRRSAGFLAALIFVVLLLLVASPALARAGRLDLTFGHSGRVITDTGDAAAEDVAIQPDGKIVAVGGFFRDLGRAAYDFAVIRYLPDGTLDPSFGSGGISVTLFGRGDSLARAVAIQPDGRIVVAGEATERHGGEVDFALARYDPDGTLDRTFGEDGILTHRFDANHAAAWDVALQPDGKIVAVGYTDTGPFTRDFAVARYTPDGKLDPAFDRDGKVVTQFEEGDVVARGVVLQPDGRIVTGGSVDLPLIASGFALARYLPDGRLDTAFGSQGKIVTEFPEGSAPGFDVALQADGRIVAAGYTFPTGRPRSFALARYIRTGHLDDTFGDGGLVVTEFPGGASGARSVAIQSDGKIVAAGNANGIEDPEPKSDFGLARYDPDGTLDPTFGLDGLVTTSMGKTVEVALGLAVQADGKIVAAGFGARGLGGQPFGFALARYEGT